MMFQLVEIFGEKSECTMCKLSIYDLHISDVFLLEYIKDPREMVIVRTVFTSVLKHVQCCLKQSF